MKEDVKEDEKIRVLLATEQGANTDLPTKVNGGDDATIGQLAISKKDKEGAGSEAEKKHHGTTVKVKNNVGGRTTAGQKVKIILKFDSLFLAIKYSTRKYLWFRR